MIIQQLVSMVLVRLVDGTILSVPVIYGSTRQTLWVLSHKHKDFTPLYVIKHTWDVNVDMNTLLGVVESVEDILQWYNESQYTKIVTYTYLDETFKDDVLKYADGTYNYNNVNELLGIDALLVLLLDDSINEVLNTLRDALATGTIVNHPVPRKWLLVENHIMWYSIVKKDKKIRLLLNRRKSTVARQLTILKKLLGHYTGAPCRYLNPQARKADIRCKCSTLSDIMDSCDFCKAYKLDETLRDYYETQIESIYSSIRNVCDIN